MFDSIGRRGRVKNLSPFRWLLSTFLSGVLLASIFGAVDVIKSGPKAEGKVEEVIEDVTFKQSLPPPPPPPPPPPAARPPKSTTRPQKTVITKKVVQKEIKDPDPTPVPKKDEKEDTPTPEPEELFDSGGVEGGVVGGVLGGVIGGQLGSNTYGSSNIQEVDVNSIQKIKNVGFVYPPLAKRGNVEGSVLVEVTCSPDGKVQSIAWIRGNIIFKESVEAAIRQWQFAPRPISFKFQQPVNFTLKK